MSNQNNIIAVPFCPYQQQEIYALHWAPSGTFSSIEAVTKLTGYRASVIKAILKKVGPR